MFNLTHLLLHVWKILFFLHFLRTNLERLNNLPNVSKPESEETGLKAVCPTVNSFSIALSTRDPNNHGYAGSQTRSDMQSRILPHVARVISSEDLVRL